MHGPYFLACRKPFSLAGVQRSTFFSSDFEAMDFLISSSTTAPLSIYFEEAGGEPSSGLPSNLVTAFADATGWELGVVDGQVQIVDMSATWPPSRATANRRMCDQLAAEISKLVGQSN